MCKNKENKNVHTLARDYNKEMRKKNQREERVEELKNERSSSRASAEQPRSTA